VNAWTLALAGAVLLALGSAPRALSDDPPARGLSASPRRPSNDPHPGIALDRRTQDAIKSGLDYLAARRNPNGSWSDVVGRKVHMMYYGMEAEHVGVTALAGIAFLASGSLPDQGPYGPQIRGALEYILNQVQENGYITANGSRMYEHAFATLFLAEIYGMTPDERVKEKLKLAVRLIEKAQNPKGGWRYLPYAQDADMSVTVCQVMGLRAARNAGIQVNRATIDKAIEYVRNSFHADEGAFEYQISQYSRGYRTSFALTAAGVATLYGAGQYDAFEIKRGLEYLWRSRPDIDSAENHFDYYYGQYYAVQAMFQAGGSFWGAWYRYIRDELIGAQSPDGSWRDLVGPNYATAMATIILQIPYQYLPITER
jgi:prenyltransferase/squalene oxidase-like repeat protein